MTGAQRELGLTFAPQCRACDGHGHHRRRDCAGDGLQADSESPRMHCRGQGMGSLSIGSDSHSRVMWPCLLEERRG